jgi:hypothetical protein
MVRVTFALGSAKPTSTSELEIHADLAQIDTPRRNRNGILLHPIQVRINTPLMQDQFRCPTVGVGHKGDLSVKDFKK